MKVMDRRAYATGVERGFSRPGERAYLKNGRMSSRCFSGRMMEKGSL